MKYFLYRIDGGTPKTEEWLDRTLIIKAVGKVDPPKKKTGGKQTIELLVRDTQLNLAGAQLLKAYAIESDPGNGVDSATFEYFYLQSFDVVPHKDKGFKTLVLWVSPF